MLDDDGSRKLAWLKKDYEATKFISSHAPGIVSKWCELLDDGHFLLLPAYTQQDDWTWHLPKGKEQEYIDAVVTATAKLEDLRFGGDDKKRLNIQPYFRDKIALDGGFEMFLSNNDARQQVIRKLQCIASTAMSHRKLLEECVTAIRVLTGTGRVMHRASLAARSF